MKNPCAVQVASFPEAYGNSISHKYCFIAPSDVEGIAHVVKKVADEDRMSTTESANNKRLNVRCSACCFRRSCSWGVMLMLLEPSPRPP